MTKRSLPSYLAAALGAAAAFHLAACGDNGDGEPSDDPTDAAGSPDAAVPPPDAPPPDGPAPFVVPTPFAVPLSAAGPDQLQSVVAGPNGTFYAAGFAAATLTGPRLVSVVKLTATGALDPSFGGGDGIATTTLEFKGGSGEVGLAVQPSGKLVVSATVANATNPADRDVAVIRLDASGAPDAGFGVGGVRVLDLGTAHDDAGTLRGFDAARGLAIGAGGVIYVYALAHATGTTGAGAARTDVDLTLVKLDVDGTPDASFGGGAGRFTLDLQNVSETARGINLLPDGGILLSGYANTPGLGSVQPVLVKVTAAGMLDRGFATGGVFHDTVLAVQTEVYNAAVHPSFLVTCGYGRQTGTQNDWVALRFELPSGLRSTSFGGAPGGAVTIDPSGTMVGDNCRGAIALPDGRTLLYGSTGPGNMPAQDAVFAVLDSAGRLDPAFGDGVHQFPLGANGNDQFWGAAVSGGKAIVVGWKGGGMTPSESVNDDAYGAIVALP